MFSETLNGNSLVIPSSVLLADINLNLKKKIISSGYTELKAQYNLVRKKFSQDSSTYQFF